METEGARIKAYFRRRDVRIVLILLTMLIVVFSLPIWHRHGDIAGKMHGHAIWDGGHIH